LNRMQSQESVKLDQKSIRTILPHQPPFVYIDEVFDLIPGQSAKARKYIDPKDPIFSCHFPGQPIYPGIFLIEAAGQLAFVTIRYQLNSEEATPSKVGYLGSVKNFTFRNVITPGMTLIIAVEVIIRFGNATKVSARILCGEEIMADGELYFTIAEGEEKAHL
jgi:3-hydroxyacyl-[acyl-carrier-protein] dehydratase